MVKGKFSYLSPEAASGQEVDARADIFAVGIMLWEMLAGQRLFCGETDYATVKLIQKANIPRLAPLNREVDEAFEEVLVRALDARSEGALSDRARVRRRALRLPVQPPLDGDGVRPGKPGAEPDQRRGRAAPAKSSR